MYERDFSLSISCKALHVIYPTILVLLTLCFSGCVRFTPSSADLHDSEEAKYEGEKAFYAHSEAQNKRLKKLIEERSQTGIAGGSDGIYKVGTDDIIELYVFETEELNRKVRVRPDGTISAPLLGKLKVIGLTEDEVQKRVTDRLKVFMHDPQVQVFIHTYAAHKVWVIGEIHDPGPIALTRNNYSLIELLSEAGGRTERASGTIILIPRSEELKSRSRMLDADTSILEQKEGPNEVSNEMMEAGDVIPERKEQIKEVMPKIDEVAKNRNGIEIDYEDLIGSNNTSPMTVPLRAGDTVVVPEIGRIQIAGEVGSPGSYPLNKKMTLMAAIAAAKGLSYAADSEQVEIIRELGAGKKAMVIVDTEKIALEELKDIPLRDGDVVRVPSATGRFYIAQVFSFFNSLLGRAVAPVQPN